MPFQSSFEDDINMKCKDCISKTNIKAELACEHSICKNCLVKGLMEKFCANYNYVYRAFCKECNTLVNISILSFNNLKKPFT